MKIGKKKKKNINDSIRYSLHSRGIFTEDIASVSKGSFHGNQSK